MPGVSSTVLDVSGLVLSSGSKEHPEPQSLGPYEMAQVLCNYSSADWRGGMGHGMGSDSVWGQSPVQALLSAFKLFQERVWRFRVEGHGLLW